MERSIQLDWPAIVKEAIKQRKHFGLTQHQLALLSEVSKPTLNGFEQGKTNITVATALKILRVLGLEAHLAEEAKEAHKEGFIGKKKSRKFLDDTLAAKD